MDSANPARRDLLRMGAGVATFALASCAAGPALQQGSHFDWKVHDPAEAGISAAGLANIRAAIQRNIDNNTYTGVVSAIARRNKLVWFEAQGVRDIQTGAPMRRDDIFRMMSSSKQITAVAVLQMMEAGKLTLDDKVSRFIPAFANPKVIEAPAGWEVALLDAAKADELRSRMAVKPASREITIKDLLTHTSGLSSIVGLAPGPGAIYNKLNRTEDDTLAGIAPRLGAAALDFDPGSRWGYSPLDGFDLLLRIVEIASGVQADTYLRERIFEPLEMRDTFFNVPPEKQERVLKLYERKENAWREGTPLFGVKPTRYFSGAGGLLSTVHDYMQFEEMLLNRGTLNGRGVLRPQTVELMSRNQVGEMFAQWSPAVSAGQGFGLGVGVVQDPDVAKTGRGKGAFGWGGAYGTESWADPAAELAVVFFVQQPVRSAQLDFQLSVQSALAS